MSDRAVKVQVHPDLAMDIFWQLLESKGRVTNLPKDTTIRGVAWNAMIGEGVIEVRLESREFKLGCPGQPIPDFLVTEEAADGKAKT